MSGAGSAAVLGAWFEELVPGDVSPAGHRSPLPWEG